MARRWLVWVDGKLDGELFKVPWKARGPKSPTAPA
jgi:hypothetical protein